MLPCFSLCAPGPPPVALVSLSKLLAADKQGGVHFYDMNTEVPIMTLNVTSHSHQLTPPLLSVDWSPSNSLIVGGVASGHWCIWDVAQSRYYIPDVSSIYNPLCAVAFLDVLNFGDLDKQNFVPKTGPTRTFLARWLSVLLNIARLPGTKVAVNTGECITGCQTFCNRK